MTSVATALPVGAVQRNPLTNGETWMDQAACRNLRPTQADRLFFGDRTCPAEAVNMCLSCPVRSQCEQFARRVEHGAQYTYGLWGALSAKQRRRA